MTDPYYPPGLKMPMSEAEIEHDRLWRRQRDALTPHWSSPKAKRDNPSDDYACRARRAKMEKKLDEVMWWYSVATIGLCFAAAPIMLIALAVGGAR